MLFILLPTLNAETFPVFLFLISAIPPLSFELAITPSIVKSISVAEYIVILKTLRQRIIEKTFHYEPCN